MRLAKITLASAAVYNLLWGGFVILFPNALFDWADLPRPNYPGIWQCVGMIVGVYGIGYLIAALDPIRHWPIVLVGFLGKVFGPLGFIKAFYEGVFNLKFGITILTNDLIWLYPFFYILSLAYRAHLNGDLPNSPPTVGKLRLPSGESIQELSHRQPLLFLLLRHSGCTFCREALTEFRKHILNVQQRGIRVLIVHMGDLSSENQLKSRYDLAHAEFISDPHRMFYKFFGARMGNLFELFGPFVWIRGFIAGIVKRHGIGKLDGNGFQMGGVYFIKAEQVYPLHIPRDASDIGDWKKILADLDRV